MSDTESAEQVRDGNIRAMGAELGELFTLLSAELTWTAWRWTQHRVLFGAEHPRNLEVVNQTAPFFFWIIQQVLWEDVFLSLARLSGPAKSMGKQNLSLLRLAPLVADDLRNDVGARLDLIRIHTSFAKDWRNRHIAHRDWDLARGKAAELLAPATRAAVDDAIAEMAALLNVVQFKYRDGTTLYDGSFGSGGAGALLAVLKDGLRLERIRAEELEKENYDPRFWHDSPPAV